MNQAETFLKEIGVENRPTRSIIICTTPRSGSTALSTSLKQTNLLGYPKEYFIFLYWQKYEPERMKAAHLQRWRLPLNMYLKQMFKEGTTDNGVFSIKMMWEQFEEILINLHTFPQLKNIKEEKIPSMVFPEIFYVYWRRRDKIRQAVSYAKALQTGIFHSSQTLHYNYDDKSYTTDTNSNTRYDFYQILFLYQSLLRKEKSWEEYFIRANIHPLRLFYEDYENEIETAALKIANAFNLSIPTQTVEQKIKMKKLANSTNDVWASRFREELAKRTRTPLHKLWLHGSQACILRYHKYFKNS